MGLLFLVFGVGSLILSGVILPLSTRRQRDRAAEFRAQEWVHRVFSAFVALAEAIGTISVRYHGLERLAGGSSVLIANHPTLLDIVVLGAVLPRFDCVVKGDAFRNFFLRGIVSATGYVANTDGPDLIRECSERVLAGRTMVLFPEGTRSPVSGLGRFARGPSHIALQSGSRIIPVVIRCDPPALKKGQPWYALPNECLRFDVAVGEAIYAKDLVGSEVAPAVAARRLNDHLRSYFQARLGCHLA